MYIYTLRNVTTVIYKSTINEKKNITTAKKKNNIIKK